MLANLIRYFDDHTKIQLARDLLDVLIVYYLFYRALLVLRGTRAMQVGVGLGVVFLLYILSQLLQLATVLSVLGALITNILVVIVVVFQSDIRRGLQRVGSRALFGGLGRAREVQVIDEVVEAATELARHRIGAIITFEQDANLDEFVGIHKGHVLDAAVSSELLVSLFVPEGVNKLHDGAVVIRNYRIAKAGVFFPMAEVKIVDESFGSRHRAALGITEETDAVVVVVSEERGTISFCFNGNIASNLDGPKLRTMLEAIFSPKVRSKKRKPKRAESEPPSAGSVISVPTPATTSVRTSAGSLRPPPVEPDPDEPRESESDMMMPIIEEPTPPPSKTHDSEPPAPLRPRLVPAEDSAAISAQPPWSATATPLRTPATGRPPELAHVGIARSTETTLRSNSDEGKNDESRPSERPKRSDEGKPK